MRIAFAAIALAAVGLCASVRAGQGPAIMLADATLNPADSYFEGFFPAGNFTYFNTAAAKDTNPLWRTDGTPNGTVLLKGDGNNRPGAVLMTADGPRTLFTSSGAGPLPELWITDGTHAGTMQVASVGFIRAESMTSAGDRAYFVADDGVHGCELWRSDGTASGTYMVRDIAPGAASGIPNIGLQPVVAGSGILFFASEAGTSGTNTKVGLWRSDGTGAGTQRIMSGFQLALRYGPAWSVSANGRIYFEAAHTQEGQGLWSSDGTATGTQLALPLFDPTLTFVGPLDVNGGILLAGQRRISSDEHVEGLWWSDGTAAGTILLRAALNVFDAVRFRDRVILVGCEYWRDLCGLWQSDGTSNGTHLLIELPVDENYVPACTDFFSSVQSHLSVVNDHLFFFLRPPDGEFELWRSDGTTRGTQRVAGGFEYAGEGVPVGDRLVFVADDGIHGNELWISDGTEAGTTLLADFSPGTLGGTYNLIRIRDQAYFIGPSARCQRQLTTIDVASGSVATLLEHIAHQFTSGAEVSYLTPFEDRLLFGVRNSSRVADGLVQTSVASEGTINLFRGNVDRIWATQRHLYFTADDVLWRVNSDGDDVVAVETEIYPVTDVTEVGDHLILVSQDILDGCVACSSGGAVTVWASRGVPQTAQPIARVEQSLHRSLIVVGDDAVITTSRRDNLHRVTVWLTDGSDAGTRAVFSDWVDNQPRDFIRFGDDLYFTNSASDSGQELWSSEGTTTSATLVRDLNPGRANGVGSLVGLGGALYFVGNDGEHGDELWTTDGTASGMRMVRDIHPGPGSGMSLDRSRLSVVDGVLLFAADDGDSGAELWRSDGTSDGTYRVQDIAPGPLSSDPGDFAGNGLYITFAADDGSHGREVWRIAATAIGARCGGDCDQDFDVSVDEIVRAVEVILGAAPLSTCETADSTRDGQLSVDEIVVAITNALEGCR